MEFEEIRVISEKLNEHTGVSLEVIMPNFYAVTIGDNTYWFSYSVLIAFRSGNELHVLDNQLGTTTGRHTAYFNIVTKAREDVETFISNLAKI